MNSRLQQFLELEQLTSSTLADMLGIQRSNISHLLSGRNKPSYEFISRFMLKFPNVNMEWLINGKGKPYKEYAANTEDDSMLSLFTDPVIEPAISAPASVSTSAQPINKVIKRITIFYSDGSFDEFCK